MLKAHRTEVIGWFPENIITLRSGIQVVVINETTDTVVSGSCRPTIPTKVGEYTKKLTCPVCFKKVMIRNTKKKQWTCSMSCGKRFFDRKRKLGSPPSKTGSYASRGITSQKGRR